MRRILFTMAILALVLAPAMAELTEFQMGVAEGLEIGFFMGNLSGAGQHSIDAAREYNANVEQYNRWLDSIFGNNESMLNMLELFPLEFEEPLPISSQA